MPLFVRAGTILPLGPVKQHTDEKTDRPLSISIYPGADASTLVYEDDGRSFNYRNGEWMGIRLRWNDVQRVLMLSLAPGSRMLPPLRRNIEVNLLQSEKRIVFDGGPIEVRF
jgi:hypothetical protein